MTKEIDNYEPYGPEWVKELMKLPKPFLINMVRAANLKRKELESGASSLQGENERLREGNHKMGLALENIISLYPNNDRDGRPVIALNDIRQTAIEALNKQ